ncbi:sulfite exporter TauE/SafE family protein [Arenibaculum pallidiluteum]|uniref:sulfite exporter TauE/SafE family protein n=1 Tax=Arenibaculum pallidiluteum TaxID=2812559 RepID=UPI001A970623|nr:sulfite exporter TauE/SafE family protein [Arenibaculum pallidiluteum]
MDPWNALLLFVAAVAAGALNAVAGGGTFFTFSALVATGMPAVAANATSTAALWPGSIAGLAAYRHEARSHWQRFVVLGLVSLVGGALGAWALLVIQETTFEAMVPWLLLGATVLFGFGPQIRKIVRRVGELGTGAAGRVGPALGLAFQFLVAIYGGFFGAGLGILMLAALTLTEKGDFHVANAAKTLLAVLINGVAVALFVFGGLVHVPEAIVMLVGAVAGGYGGVAAARRVPEPILRGVVVTIGITLSLYFFFR